MKKEISWKDLVKKTAEKHKKSGKSFDFKQVLSDSGEEWKKIKSGNHAEYIQGKSSASSTRKNKSSKKSSKKEKKSRKASHGKVSHGKEIHGNCDAEMILEKANLCKSCEHKVEKLMKKQSGGKNSGLSPADYQSSAQAAQSRAPVQAPAPVQAQAPAAAPKH